MKEHVKGEPPQFLSFVRPVDEDAVNGNGPRRVDLSLGGGVVREKAQLQKRERKKKINKSVRLKRALIECRTKALHASCPEGSNKTRRRTFVYTLCIRSSSLISSLVITCEIDRSHRCQTFRVKSMSSRAGAAPGALRGPMVKKMSKWIRRRPIHISG